MAEHTEIESQQTSAKPKPQDRVLLDKFTALSDAPEAERIKKTKELLKLLSARQASHEEDGICGEISYTVSRLVQGLSSHRKFARLGYSVALCQILKSFDTVKVDHVLECVNKKAQSQLTGQCSKAETTNVYLGKIFGYLTLVHSGRLLHESKQNVRQVVQQLLKLGQEKSSLQQLCVNGLIQIIAQVKSKVFKKCILPGIETRFTEGWGNCSPDTLLLLIYSSRHHQKHVEKFLTEHWLAPQLVSEKNFTLIADVVKRSTSVYPLTHVVNEELVKCVVEQKLNIISFWTSVVRPLFDPKGLLVPKKILGLHFFELLLPHLDTSEKIESVLHPDVANVLCHFSQKQEDLGSKTTQTLKKLVEFVKTSTDPKLQLAVLKSLVRKPGHFHVDKRTKTATMSTIVTCLLPDASVVFVKELMKMFSGQPSWLYSKDDNRTECEQWSVRELDVLITMGDQSSSWQLDILQFLFLHSFFNVLKPSNDIPHCNHHTRELPETSRKCVVDNFFKAVSKCLSHSIQGQSRATVLGNHLDVLFQLMEYGQTLLDSESIVVLSQDLPESAKTEWTKLIETVKKINKKRQSDDKIRENHAFELLFLHVGLQLFTDAPGAVESLQDLHVCYKKASQKRKSKAAEDGPEWIEVITELLLSMVFKGTALSRNVAKLVLTALADHITPQAFQLIVNILEQTTVDSEEDGPLGLEEDDENMDDEELNDENADESNEEDNINDSSDDDDSDDDDDDEADSGLEEEPNVNVDDELKKKVKTALGDAAVDSDDEEDESDLSDSEMFKFDDMLAEAFKSMRKGKKTNKEQEKQLKDFKMRVLDLIAVIIKHHPTSALVKDMIFPLLDIMEGGKRKEEQQLLGKKATEVFNTLYKVKKIIPDISVDRDELLDMVTQLIQYSHKVSSDDMVKEVAKACLLVIRLLLNIEDSTGPSPLKTRSKAKAVEKTTKTTKDHDYYQEQVIQLIQTSLHKLLHKTEGNKSPLLIQTMVERYPLMFWSLSDDLLSTMSDRNVKVYQRTQACGMLASMINKHLVTEIGEESWNDFLDLLQEISSKILSSLTTETYKAQFMKELLTVYGKIVVISVEDCRKVLGDSGLQKLDSLRTSFSTDIRVLYNKVAKPLGHGGDSLKEGKKKKNKKRRPNTKDDNIDDNTTGNSSPLKRPKLDDAKAVEKTSNRENNNDFNQVKSTSPKVGKGLKRDVKNIGNSVQNDGGLNGSLVEKENKKKHKKRKRSKSRDNNTSLMADTSVLEESVNLEQKLTNENVVDEIVTEGVKKDARESNAETNETPRSKKKHKKRKSSGLGDSNVDISSSSELKQVTQDSSPTKKESSTFENGHRDEVEMNGTEEESPSSKKKKHKKRKSTETQEAVNGTTENSEAKELDVKAIVLNEETNDVLEMKSTSPKKSLRKHRNSHAPESNYEKDDKFSPRHTRSMKKV